MEREQLVSEIQKLKQETGAVVLAHTYQIPDIIDLADITGDSFKLSQRAVSVDARTIIMCGVRFMAETVKILSPEKKVILAAPDATCPMAEQISPERVAQFKKQNPDVAVCAYINTTAALKAECDFCVTSSSAVKIVKKIPNKSILFIPDKNLGAFVAKSVPEKNMILWDGYCPVHNTVTAEDIREAKRLHPGAPVAIHPECPADAVTEADFVGSTAAIIDFAKNQPGDVIIATEARVSEYLSLKIKDRRFWQPCPQKFTCADMQLTGLEELRDALAETGGVEITLDEPTRRKAKICIDRMLQYGG